MNKNKGIIGIGLILVIVLVIAIVGGGAYYLGKNSNKLEVKSPESILPNNESQKLPEIDNSISTPTPVPAVTDTPLITSIYPSSGSVGTIIELKGSNLAGFEGDLDAVIENDKGESAFLKGIGLVPREDQTIRAKIEDKVCKQNNSYSGEPCTSWMTLIPGTYKVYTMPWGKKSNEMLFTINSLAPTANLKTFTGTDYGFSFNYPGSWKLSEDKSKKEVTVNTNDIASGTGGDYSYPSWSITFKATDKSFFNNNRVSTKYGIITYDENLKALMSDQCLKAEKLLGGAVQAIRYGGSLMSDPAYSNSAILTNSGNIINVDSYQGVVITPEISNQLSIIANSFKLLNGNTVFVPACAK